MVEYIYNLEVLNNSTTGNNSTNTTSNSTNTTRNSTNTARNSTKCEAESVTTNTTSNCTQSVSTRITYKKAFEYVLSDNKTDFYLFAVVECRNENIKLDPPFDHLDLNRQAVGYYAVFLDLAYMGFFLLCIWVMSYLVSVDAERHRNLLFESREFAVEIFNLPKLTDNYTIEQLKADLFVHLENVLKSQPQQIDRLQTSIDSRGYEIMDIQFGMSDYQFLNELVKINR